MTELRIGSRGSRLALWQAEYVQGALAGRGIPSSITRIKTTGDLILDRPLAEVGGKGLFVKEIEEALLRNEIDLAVHSMKDLPAHLPVPLMLTAVTRREDPRDALVSHSGLPLLKLPPGATIGTSALRRQSQILARRPDLRCLPIRGNLDTRLKKVADGVCDAVIVAAAGLHRMGWQDQITEYLPIEVSLPAIGQGALGLECRREDTATQNRVAFLNDADTACCVAAERGMLLRLEGDCQTPIAGHAIRTGDRLTLTGLVASVDGTRLLRECQTGAANEAVAEQLGFTVAECLLERGARALLSRP